MITVKVQSNRLPFIVKYRLLTVCSAGNETIIFTQDSFSELFTINGKIWCFTDNLNWYYKCSAHSRHTVPVWNGLFAWPVAMPYFLKPYKVICSIEPQQIRLQDSEEVWRSLKNPEATAAAQSAVHLTVHWSFVWVLLTCFLIDELDVHLYRMFLFTSQFSELDSKPQTRESVMSAKCCYRLLDASNYFLKHWMYHMSKSTLHLLGLLTIHMPGVKPIRWAVFQMCFALSSVDPLYFLWRGGACVNANVRVRGSAASADFLQI